MNKIFLILTILFFASTIYGADFTVKIKQSENSNNYLQPTKAGKELTFAVRIKNNMKETCTITYKKQWYTPNSWTSTNVSDITLKQNQEGEFQLTIAIPSNEPDGMLTLQLDFEAKLSNGKTVTFNSTPQTIIIDNSAPDKPTYNVSKSSYGIIVSNIMGYDYMSSTYTTWSNSSGIMGIKKFNFALKKGDTTIKSESKDATKIDYYSIDYLDPNTTYKVQVTATDLAGNTSDIAETIVRTAPTPPIAHCISKGYKMAKLAWNSIDGAVGYYIYKKEYKSNDFVLVNKTPIKSNNYTLESLKSNTSYQYYVVAVNSENTKSDRGKEQFFQTEKFPMIEGNNQVCNTGSWKYKLKDNLLSGYTVSWSCSSNITLLSSSELQAQFKAKNKKSLKNDEIKATIKTPNGKIDTTITKEVFVGKPLAPTQILGIPITKVCAAGSQYSFSTKTENAVMVNSYNWQVSKGSIYGKNSQSTVNVIMPKMRAGTLDDMLTIEVCNINSCGSSTYYSENLWIRAGLPLRIAKIIEQDSIYGNDADLLVDIKQDIAKGGYSIFPNPAQKELQVSASNKSISSIDIYDVNGKLQIEQLFDANTTKVKIDISNFNQGLYILIINKIAKYNFIKQ